MPRLTDTLSMKIPRIVQSLINVNNTYLKKFVNSRLFTELVLLYYEFIMKH